MTTPLESPWRDMASAPKDGSDILVYDPNLEKDERVQIAFWNDVLNYWQPLNENSADPEPTCWMHKPSPPNSIPPPSTNELLEAAKEARITELEAEVKALREALKPFARMASDIHEAAPDGALCVVATLNGGIMSNKNFCSVGDLRRARSLIPESNNGEAGE